MAPPCYLRRRRKDPIGRNDRTMAKAHAQSPVKASYDGKQVLLTALLRLAEQAPGYLVGTFIFTYGTTVLGVWPRQRRRMRFCNHFSGGRQCHRDSSLETREPLSKRRGLLSTEGSFSGQRWPEPSERGPCCPYTLLFATHIASDRDITYLNISLCGSITSPQFEVKARTLSRPDCGPL
jgi:hypothetical protein